MDPLSIRCPNCGASITEIPISDLIKCNFCGTVFRLQSCNTDLSSLKDFVIKSNVLITYNSSNAQVTIPYGVEKIADEVFRNSGIESILLPSSLKEIGAYAFADCKNLCSITIPKSVHYIGNRAFWRCTSLAQIEFLNDDTLLGDGVILGTKAYKNYLQSYDIEVKSQLEEEALKKRRAYGLCPYCGSNYNIFGKCKSCGKKRK